jgi:hypothetical protein
MRGSRSLLVVIIAVASLSIVGMASAAPVAAGTDDDSGLPADLTTQDYGFYVLTEQDVSAVPGLRRGEPYSAEAPSSLPSDEDVATCGDVAGYYRAGARAEISGSAQDENALPLTVLNKVGAVDDAKKTLADLKTFAENCTEPWADGQFAPAANQPKVKKAGDGIVAFAASDLRPPPSTTYLLYVREGKHFISTVFVGIDGVDAVLKRSDLNRLAKGTAGHLADLAREYRRS